MAGSPTTQGVYRPVPESAVANNARNMTSINGLEVGALAAQPAAGSVAVSITRSGPYFQLTFTLTEASIPVTDGAGSGSHGTLKLFTFNPAAISFLGARQDYTDFVEGDDLSGGAGDGDSVFEIGVGTTAISAAADGTLGNGVNENVGQAVAVNMGSATSGTAVDGAKTTALDGTSTAISLNLNWSGTAATVDASSTITATGTITVCGVMLGDD